MDHGNDHHGGCCGGHHGDDAEAALTIALDAIRAAGMRVTAPRTAMLRVLAKARSPLSVEDIRRSAGKDADLVTAYRTMESMEKLGVVRRHPLESGKNLYEIADPSRPEAHHHHVVCRVCGRMEPLEGCQAASVEKAAAKRGFVALTHVLEVYGVCADCAKKAKKTA